MPPKYKTLEELVAHLSTQINELSGKFDDFNTKQDNLDTKVTKLSDLLEGVREENAKLKTTVDRQEKEMVGMKVHINNLEQHNRADCVRILNVPIPGNASNFETVANCAYRIALLPILEGAAAAGRLINVPSCAELIKTAHILPGKKDIKPIFVRFNMPHVKSIIMQMKKELAPRAAAAAAGHPGRPGGKGPLLYPIYDDMTRDNFRMQQAIAADDRVQACWFAGGSLRVKLVNSDVAHRVHNIYLPMDDIIASLS